MSLLGRVKNNPYLNIFVFDMLSKCIIAGTTIFLIRGLTINDYSGYTVFYTIASYILGVAGNGISVAFTRYYVEYRLRYNKKAEGLYRFILLIFVLLLSGTLLFTILNKKIPFLYNIAIVYGFSLCIDKINVSYFQANEEYSLSGIVNNLKNIFNLIVIVLVFFLYKEIPLHILCITYVSINILINIFVCNIILKKEVKGTFYKAIFHLKKITKDSIYILIYMTFLSAFNNVDIFFIKFFCNDLAVAEYGIAYKYYMLLLSLLPAIQIIKNIKTSRPELIDDEVRRRKMVIDWIKKTTPLAFIFLIIGIPVTYMFFPILNGIQYNGAIPAFIILMIGAMTSYITSPNVNVMLATKKGTIICLYAILAFFSNLIGNSMFIPKYGIIAASVTTVFSNFTFNGLCTWYIVKKNNSL